MAVTSGLWRFLHHLEMLKILENAEIVLVKLQLIEASYTCSLHKGLIHLLFLFSVFF